MISFVVTILLTTIAVLLCSQPVVVEGQSTTPCASDSDVLSSSAVMKEALAFLAPSQDCGSDDSAQNNCTFDYGTARGNSDQYETACLDQGGQFYRYDATVNCAEDGNNRTTVNEVHTNTPDCVATSCSTTDEATEYFKVRYGIDCNVSVIIVKGPVAKASTSNSSTTGGTSSGTSGTRNPTKAIGIVSALSMLISILCAFQ